MGYGVGLRDAYQQGYDDALAGLDPRPPKHIPTTHTGPAPDSSSGASSGFGIGSIFRYAMIGQYIYRAGSGPCGFSAGNLIANLQANPMQAVMMLMMVGGGGFF